MEGEMGFCGLSSKAVISRALPHFGEEPPVSGTRGAGTIFFSSCNLRCVYCQNYQISRDVHGELINSNDLADIMLNLQGQGCHNIEAVTPTPHVASLVEALVSARRKGLILPLIYNCGGYENPAVISLLDGFVDIYLPDFKYGNDDDAWKYSGVKNYPYYALASISEMVRQKGDMLEIDGERAVRGVIIRHLVLPGRTKNSFAVLRLIKQHISVSVPISIMSQYTPVASVARDPFLGRQITRHEYEQVVNEALDLGFEYIFTQEVDGKPLVPNFEQEHPFEWT